jgi:hypothetical protein
MKKQLIKFLVSGEFWSQLDQNSDGKVTWNEIKTTPVSVWFDFALRLFAIYQGYELLT